ncbi:Metallothionein expression activator [Elasticomyces elasticus]|nr:Metallothionein expression activator [Elasticomyces elasticus]KAK4979287.1 Metallothionein expression activator [Elasticomyces elasticus]
MLSSNSSSSSSSQSSSIQKRRQNHRRQQSLEVPILATPLPGAGHHRRNQSHSHANQHRRGLSLDQSVTASFRPLQPIAQEQRIATSSPAIRLDTTNLQGQPTITNQQHFVQETQQTRIPTVAQPGQQQIQQQQAYYQLPPQPAPVDFQSHLQQQLNAGVDVDFKPVLIQSPQPQSQQQLRALQELENHMAWYRDNFSHSPNSVAAQQAQQQQAMFEMPQAFAMNQQQQTVPGAQMPMLMMQQPMQQQQQATHTAPSPHSINQQSIHTAPQTPVPQVQVHARTVPNTPQNYTQSWPSPPTTHAKHARSQSFQLDVAPMPAQQQQFTHNFVQDAAAFSNDAGYASSAYSSSEVGGAVSPHPQQSAGPLPTLFEEPSLSFNNQQASGPFSGQPQQTQGPFDGTSILLQATASVPDFNDPGYSFDHDGPLDMSPRQQLLNNLGPDVPASIVETGVNANEVQQYIGDLDNTDNKYPCMFPHCLRRFGRKENVRAHVQTHLGDRQFKCNLCDKTFVRQHDLKRHIAIHSEARPFVCPCGTGFARHDALTRHRQRGMCPGVLPGFEKTEEERPKRGRPRKERKDGEERRAKKGEVRKKNAGAAKGGQQASDGAGQEEEDEGMEDVEAQLLQYASSGSSNGSEGGSERGFPTTPPDSFDADAFLNMTNAESAYTNISSWRDTPPTSPVSPSPSKNTIDEMFDFDAPVGKEVGVSPAALSVRSPPQGHNIEIAVRADTPQSTTNNNEAYSYASPAASAATNAGASGSFHGGESPVENEDEILQWISGPDNTAIGAEAEAQLFNDIFSPGGDSNGSSSVYNYSDNDMDTDMFDKQLDHFVASTAPNAGMFVTAMPEQVGGMYGEGYGGEMMDDWFAAGQ